MYRAGVDPVGWEALRGQVETICNTRRGAALTTLVLAATTDRNDIRWLQQE